MQDVARELERWRQRGDRVALATVVATRRSAPRPVGSVMAISDSGEITGSVSGGCVESEVYAHGREVLAGGEARLLSFGITDDEAFEVGLPCGGEIDVFVRAADPEVLAGALRAVEQEQTATLVSVVAGDGVGAERLEDGAVGPSVLVEQNGKTLFRHVLGPPPRLVVFGAVDTAESLCRIVRGLGWRTVVADPRAKFATRERLPSADELVVGWPADLLADQPPDATTAVVVLTHDERVDVPALLSALASDAFYVGVLGSRRRQRRLRERLAELGVGDDGLERLSGPAGLDLAAEAPAEVAVSIVAEILACRAGRAGGRLRETDGRIHPDSTAVPVRAG